MASIDERLQRIEAQIQQLNDVEAVRKNLAAYCRAVDAKDIKLLESLFSRDMELSVSPWSFEFRGRGRPNEYSTFPGICSNDFANAKHAGYLLFS